VSDVPVILNITTTTPNVVSKKPASDYVNKTPVVPNTPKVKTTPVIQPTPSVVRETRDSSKTEAPSKTKYESKPSIRDSLINDYEEHKERKDNSKIRLGLETAVGTNGEGIFGAFVNIPLIHTSLDPQVILEVYSNVPISKGNSVASDNKKITTVRETQWVGPGTYKDRTDEITTITEDKRGAEIGAGILFGVEKFEFPLKAGVNLSSQDGMMYGQSTIIHRRNMEDLSTVVITNSKSAPDKNVTNLSLSAGAHYHVKKNLTLGASLNRVGKSNSARLNLRYKFK
jgi:hypothetical protein